MGFWALNESDEWYLPELYARKIHQALGGITLDAASCHEANQVIKADRFYDAHQNALEHYWIADTVYCNPPFSKVGMFVNTMLYEYEQKRFDRGILLVNASTETKWFQRLYRFPVLFLNHRISFTPPKGHEWKMNEGKTACLLDARLKGIPRSGNTKGQALILFPSWEHPEISVMHFREVFQDMGSIVRPYPKQNKCVVRMGA